MDEEIRELLNEEIARQIKNLSELSDASEEKARAIDNLVKLYKLRIEENNNEGELDEKQSRRFMEDNQADDEHDIQKAQLAEQAMERRFKLITEVTKVSMYLLFNAALAYAGFKFEENGVVSSFFFKNFIQKSKTSI